MYSSVIMLAEPFSLQANCRLIASLGRKLLTSRHARDYSSLTLQTLGKGGVNIKAGA